MSPASFPKGPVAVLDSLINCAQYLLPPGTYLMINITHYVLNTFQTQG